MLHAILLAIWAFVACYEMLGPKIFLGRPMVAGTVAGLIIGHLTLGMAVGGTIELSALGVYTYGGASIPDFLTGAIVGTAAAAKATGSFASQVGIGIGIGITAAVLLIALDPVRRFVTVFWIHRADAAALQGKTREMTWLHLTAFLPWGIVQAIPTFIGSYYAGHVVSTIENNVPQGFETGMALVAGVLPALGMAMLLTYLPLRRYWYMPFIGFVLFAWLKVPLQGIALFAIAIAIMFVTLKPGAGPPAAAAAGTAPGTAASTPEGASHD